MTEQFATIRPKLDIFLHFLIVFTNMFHTDKIMFFAGIVLACVILRSLENWTIDMFGTFSVNVLSIKAKSTNLGKINIFPPLNSSHAGKPMTTNDKTAVMILINVSVSFTLQHFADATLLISGPILEFGIGVGIFGNQTMTRGTIGV